MMTTQSKWLWIGGVVVAAVIARLLGASINTLLLVGAILLCPAAMYFGMRGMGAQQNQHGPTDDRDADKPRKEFKAEDNEQSGNVRNRSKP